MRIVVADDSVLFREGLVRLLTDDGHDVVDSVGDAHALQAAVDRHRPGFALIDVRMPPTMTHDGARAARALRERHPDLPMMLPSQHVETRHSVALVASGGFGYLLKDRVLRVADFLDAVHRVAGGGSALDPQVVAALLAPGARHAPLDDLTDREHAVLSLVAQGHSNAAVADAPLAGRLNYSAALRMRPHGGCWSGQHRRPTARLAVRTPLNRWSPDAATHRATISGSGSSGHDSSTITGGQWNS